MESFIYLFIIYVQITIKKYPYDWFCGPGSHTVYMHTNNQISFNFMKLYVSAENCRKKERESVLYYLFHPHSIAQVVNPLNLL